MLNNAAVGGYAVPAPGGGVTLSSTGERLFADVNRHPTIHKPLFAKERYKMAGTKTALTVDVNADHIGLISAAKEKYNIADEGKVVRIVMDYLVTNPGIHDTVFKDVRCLRCE